MDKLATESQRGSYSLKKTNGKHLLYLCLTANPLVPFFSVRFLRVLLCICSVTSAGTARSNPSSPPQSPMKAIGNSTVSINNSVAPTMTNGNSHSRTLGFLFSLFIIPPLFGYRGVALLLYLNDVTLESASQAKSPFFFWLLCPVIPLFFAYVLGLIFIDHFVFCKYKYFVWFCSCFVVF